MAAGGLAMVREGPPVRGGSPEDSHRQFTLCHETFASLICKVVENNIYLTVLSSGLNANTKWVFEKHFYLPFLSLPTFLPFFFPSILTSFFLSPFSPFLLCDLTLSFSFSFFLKNKSPEREILWIQTQQLLPVTALAWDWGRHRTVIVGASVKVMFAGLAWPPRGGRAEMVGGQWRLGADLCRP